MSTLTTVPNPHRDQAITADFCHALKACSVAGKTDVVLTYKPDRDAVAPDVLCEWLNAQAQQKWSCLEDFAGALLKDFYDTLLPQEITLTLSTTTDVNGQEVVQKVVVTKCQPQHKR